MEAATILLVDDEPDVIEGLKRGMHKLPYNLLWAYSGRDALKIMEERPVDVLVADEMMPEMSGSELLAYAKENHPNVLRIMLTGHASVTSAMNAIYEGWVYQYLHKPCRAADLAAVIYNGLLMQSLQSKEEGPHVVMSAQEQDALLERVSRMKT
jgi:DNA-binding NtrC family response regulator